MSVILRYRISNESPANDFAFSPPRSMRRPYSTGSLNTALTVTVPITVNWVPISHWL